MKVYFNGPILTMEDDAREAEILIEENGKILYVGTKADADIPDSAEWCDLNGHTLMPAFLDCHGHFSNTGIFLKTAFLQSAECFEDIVRIMKEFDDAHADAPLTQLVGMSYDHNFLKEQAHPTKDILDQICATRPVVILHTSMHMGVVNSKMLELAGINKDTPEIPGGVIARDANGEPTGLLEEVAIHSVLHLVSDVFSVNEQDLVQAQNLYIENGILTVQEGAGSNNNIDLTRAAAEQGQLKVDVISYPCLSSQSSLRDDVHGKYADCLNQYVNHFKIGGYKIVLDGSPQCKTAWLTKPYEGEETSCGYPWLTDEQVQACVDTAIDDKMQLLCHCNGDASGDQFLNAYEKSVARFAEDAPEHALRPVMIHCQTVRDDQLDRMAKLHMIASIFVAHVNYWGDVHLKNLGPVRGPHISPVRAALDRGICVNFHTDTPVVMPYMFHTVWAAVNRITRSGHVLGADQRVDVWEALKALTIDGAYSYFEEDIKGSLKAGKNADLIVIDKNPLTVEPTTLKDIKVLATIKDGELLYQAK